MTMCGACQGTGMAMKKGALGTSQEVPCPSCNGRGGWAGGPNPSPNSERNQMLALARSQGLGNHEAGLAFARGELVAVQLPPRQEPTMQQSTELAQELAQMLKEQPGEEGIQLALERLRAENLDESIAMGIIDQITSGAGPSLPPPPRQDVKVGPQEAQHPPVSPSFKASIRGMTEKLNEHGIDALDLDTDAADELELRGGLELCEHGSPTQRAQGLKIIQDIRKRRKRMRQGQDGDTTPSRNAMEEAARAGRGR